MKKALIALVVISFPAVALAQDSRAEPDATPEVVAKLFDCRAIEDADSRLACYDREVASVMQARESRELVIAGPEQVKEARRGLFGFTLPKIGLFGGDDDKDEVKEIIATIDQAYQTRDGRYTLVLEGGGRWVQSDNTSVLRSIEKGEQVVIKKAALGSYLAKVGNRRAFRAKRVD